MIGRCLAAIRSNCNEQNLLFYALKSHFFEEDMIGGGAILLRSQSRNLFGVELVQPSEHAASMFMGYVRPMDRQMTNLQKTIEQPAKARDHFLPRLMSGELAA